MSLNKTILGVVTAVAILWSAGPARAAEWTTDYKAALAEAKRTNKAVLADFTGSDWCTWCQKLKREVFDTEAFKAWADKHVILLELDYPQAASQPDALKRQNKELLKEFAVSGFPTVIFLDGDGKELGRSEYIAGGPEAWTKNADGFLPHSWIHQLIGFIEIHPHWAYVVLFIWTLIEGETIVIICGILANSQHSELRWELVALFALLGSLSGDNAWFFFGRHKGKAFLARHPGWQKQAAKVYRIFEHHQDWLMLGFRFLYGVRNITPFALGISNVRARKFVICNVIGATLWAVAFTLAGYFLGQAAEGYLAHNKWKVLGGVFLLVFLVWLVRTLIRMIKGRKIKQAGGLPADELAVVESSLAAADSAADKAGTESKP
jgi:membrane protein DedA with SNARE-associated domain/thioredoxin-related protein